MMLKRKPLLFPSLPGESYVLSHSIRLLKKYKGGIDHGKFLAGSHKRNDSLISSSCPAHEIKSLSLLRIERLWKRLSFGCYVQWPLPAPNSDISIYLAFPWKLSTPTWICHTESPVSLLLAQRWSPSHPGNSWFVLPSSAFLITDQCQRWAALQTIWAAMAWSQNMNDKMLYVGVCLRSVIWGQHENTWMCF